MFEMRIAMVAVHYGIETLERRSETPTLTAELGTLSKLSDQACEVLETFQKIVTEHLSQQSGDVGG